jgi:hypothetical protein
MFRKKGKMLLVYLTAFVSEIVTSCSCLIGLSVWVRYGKAVPVTDRVGP